MIQAYLAQIERFNPTYNAIVSLRDYDELISEVKEADADREILQVVSLVFKAVN